MYAEYHNLNSGYVEVICGPMFCGKTEELIRRVKRALISKQNVIIFKPKIDDRYHPENVVSHNDVSIQAIAIDHIDDIFKHLKHHNVIAIDEAQFFDEDLPEVCQQMALAGKRVIIAGLDMDFKGRPFGPMPHMLAVAEYITKVHAICQHCGNLATHSYRLVTEGSTVMLGEKESYEARCRTCYNMGNILNLPVQR